MTDKKTIWKSPIWFVPVILLLTLGLIEALHISMHGKYCKTEAQWMNDQGLQYDRELNVD